MFGLTKLRTIKVANEIKRNMEATGNIWGTTIDYVYNFKVKLPFRWEIEVAQRRKSNFMGRFGGGWQYKLGLQGSGSSWLIYYLVGSIWIRRRKA
jgi:hypothetical protein